MASKKFRFREHQTHNKKGNVLMKSTIKIMLWVLIWMNGWMNEWTNK